MSEGHGGRRSRQRLTERDLHRFDGDSLHDSVGRVLCGAAALPRKEFHESWAFARKVLRRLRGGPVVDAAGGHGLVGWLIALQDRGTTTVRVVDTRVPESAARIHAVLSERWPTVGARVRFVQADLASVPVLSGERWVAAHACGGLTDVVLERVIAAGARVAVMPCCHAKAKLDAGALEGWLDHDVAVDVVRARRLAAAGYRVWTTTVPEDITPKGRVLVGWRPQPEVHAGDAEPDALGSRGGEA